MKILFFCFLLLLSSISHANGEVIIEEASDAFSEATLVGMKLSTKQGFKNNEFSKKTYDCIQNLNSNSFKKLYQKLLTENLSPDELKTTNEFYSSKAGIKYTKYGILQIYSSVGESIPEPFPSFTSNEEKTIKNFVSTSAGKKLVVYRIMESTKNKKQITDFILKQFQSCK